MERAHKNLLQAIFSAMQAGRPARDEGCGPESNFLLRRNKNLLLLGMCGNLLCWVGDVLLSVFPGQETVSGLRLSPAWADAPLWRFSLSAILGGIAMMAVLCGFYAVYQILKPDAPRAAGLFMLGGLLGCIPGTMNLGGAGIFLGLWCCLRLYKK